MLLGEGGGGGARDFPLLFRPYPQPIFWNLYRSEVMG